MDERREDGVSGGGEGGASGVHERLVRFTAQVPVLSSRHARVVVGVYLLLTVVMFHGLTLVEFQSNVVDLMPRDNPNTKAAKNVSQEFPENYYVIAVEFHIDPEKWEEANQQLPNRTSPERPENITDEVYIRGLYEFNEFFLREVPSARWNITLDTYVRVINWTNSRSCVYTYEAGGECTREGEPAAWEYLPPTTPDGEAQFQSNWETFYGAAPAAADAITSPEWNATRSVYQFDPPPDATTVSVGHEVIDAWREYQEWAPENARWDVFDFEKSTISVRQPTIVDAHTTDVTTEDVVELGPVVALFILGALYLAFRNGRSIAVAGASLAMGAVWGFGIMGYLGIPLNTLNIALVPLILGNGIDYSIHFINEFLEGRKEGLDDEGAFRFAGRHAGVALVIASATTITGLSVMMFSPSVLMAQVAFVSAVGMAVVLLLSLTFIPAGMTLLGTGGLETVFEETRVFPALGRAIASHRGVAIVAVLAVTAGALYTGSQVETEAYGTPALNFPEGDWAREAYKTEMLYYYGSENPTNEFGSHWVIVEGDLESPETFEYLCQIERKLRSLDEDFVRRDGVRGICYVVEVWQQIKGGTTGAGLGVALQETNPNQTQPQTREEVNSTYTEIWQSPVDTYLSLFLNYPRNDIGIVHHDMNVSGTHPDMEERWVKFWGALDDVEEPEGVQTRAYGFMPTSYLFVNEQMPWLTYVAVTAFAVVTLLVGFFTRNLRATLAVATLVTLTGFWWLGILPLFDIGLSVALMLPIVFIMSLGSDYAVHLAWNIDREDGDAHRVFGTVGKAVMYSAITDAGAFAIFAFATYQLAAQAMLATALAIATIFVCTAAVFPLFYRDGLLPEERDPGRDEAQPQPSRGPAEA